ncbi:hypothetical protein MWU76_18835 [Gelidibacter sp. F2691]|nr:hypothetical protein [Gelidibacter sp. F2691]
MYFRRQRIEKTTSGDRNGRLSFRAFLSLLGVMALVLQPFTASLGHASNMTWIEICADEDGTYVQVDLSGESDPEADHKCCEDCTNCAICASSMTGVPHGQDGRHYDRSGLTQATILHAQTVGLDQERAWPETRGPPAAKIGKSNCAARGAFTAIPHLKGGAL